MDVGPEEVSLPALTRRSMTKRRPPYTLTHPSSAIPIPSVAHSDQSGLLVIRGKYRNDRRLAKIRITHRQWSRKTGVRLMSIDSGDGVCLPVDLMNRQNRFWHVSP